MYILINMHNATFTRTLNEFLNKEIYKINLQRAHRIIYYCLKHFI